MTFVRKLIVPILLFSFLGASSPVQECELLKDNFFIYKLMGKEVLVQFNGDKHVELHQKGKYYIKSNIEWISDCEYYLIIQDVNLPDFPFRIGSRLHTKILKVRGDRVYYKSTMGDRSWEGKMVKTEKEEE